MYPLIKIRYQVKDSSSEVIFHLLLISFSSLFMRYGSLNWKEDFILTDALALYRIVGSKAAGNLAPIDRRIWVCAH